MAESEPASPAQRVFPLEEVRKWSLVLDSQGIPNSVVPAGSGWTLLVDAAHEAQAGASLQAWYNENPQPAADAPAEVQAPAVDSWLVPMAAALILVLLLAAVHLWVVQGGGVAWREAGTADASRMFWAQPWRALTALTLHADLLHVLSNMVFGAIFGTLVLATLGPGVGAWLMALAGTAGNLLNAGTRGPTYDGLGASTAVFAAIGILAGYQLLNRPSGYRAWAPLFAAVMLLALYGMGPDTDVLAHAWGFACGLVAGALAAKTRVARLGRRTQWTLFGGLLAFVAAAWIVALGTA